MAEIQWIWRGEKSFPVPAQFVGQAIERIQETEGIENVPPQRLVDEARPEGSTLHPLFEWDDQVAAEAHRRERARNIIRALGVREVRLEIVQDRTPPAPVFVPVHAMPAFSKAPRIVTNGHDQSETESGYGRTVKIIENPDTRRQLIQAEFNRIKGLLDRTEWIAEFAPLRIAASKVEVEIFGASEFARQRKIATR